MMDMDTHPHPYVRKHIHAPYLFHAMVVLCINMLVLPEGKEPGTQCLLAGEPSTLSRESQE